MGNNRIIGLDIYRLIAIVLITNIHYFGYSHISASPDLSSFNRLFVQFSTSINSCFVDMFVLLTGYFLGKRTVKKIRLVDLWFQALIVGLIMLAVCGILAPHLITLKAVAHTILPITTFTYWYLIPYAFLFLLIPYINKLLDVIDGRNVLKVIMLWGGVMAVLELHPILSLEWFVGNYMSIVWFVYIYVIGTYISRFGFSNKKAIWLLIGVTSLALMVSVKVFDIHFPKEVKLTSFCSLPPLLLSVSLFFFFSKLKTLGKFVDTIIGSLSVSSLCVYLVQEQSSFREYLWATIRVADYANSPYLIAHWALTMLCLFVLGWITYMLYKFIYYKCILPKVINPLLGRFQKVR